MEHNSAPLDGEIDGVIVPHIPFDDIDTRPSEFRYAGISLANEGLDAIPVTKASIHQMGTDEAGSSGHECGFVHTECLL
jgi:hypothetical protein